MAHEWSTTTTANDAVLQALVDAEMVPAATAALVFADKIHSKDMPIGTPNSAIIPVNQNVTIESLSEGASQEANAHSTDGATVTLAGVGGHLDFTDELLEGGIDGFDVAVIAQAGRDMAATLDSTGLALATGLSTNVTGTSLSPLTFDDIIKGHYLVTNAKAPISAKRASIFGGGIVAGIRAVLHSTQVYHLRKAASQSGGTFLFDMSANDVVKLADGSRPPGYVGRFMGVEIWESAACPTSDTAANVNGMIFSPLAFALGVRYLTKLEKERRVGDRSTRYALTGRFGFIEVKDAWATRVRSSATA